MKSDGSGNNLSSDNESNTLLKVHGICQNNSLKYEGRKLSFIYSTVDSYFV